MLIIDLDGTFVSVNTFHRWIQFLLIEELKKFHFFSLLHILKIAFLRLIKQISHTQMKFRILKISEQHINKKQINQFVASLESYVHPDILHQLQDPSNKTLLATAAPLLYAKAMQKKYHFDNVIATAYTHKDDWKENIKEEKKNTYLKMLDTHDMHPKEVILYTDHHDDIPLMQLSDFTYLITPSKETIIAVKKANLPFEVIQ